MKSGGWLSGSTQLVRHFDRRGLAEKQVVISYNEARLLSNS